MSVEDKYKPTTPKLETEDKLKISNGAFAVCTMLEELKEQIRRLANLMVR